MLAGTNGCGKSSIAGAMLREHRADYFNPDEAARAIRDANLGLSVEEANAAAWGEGKRLLERAIAARLDYVFETTLGGRTITRLLEEAAAGGHALRVWYAGLATPELHIARVQARVARGGHDIPTAMIRKRYDAGRENLIRLLPSLTALHLYDNSAEAARGELPQPILLLHLEDGRIVEHAELRTIPTWAKPIVAATIALVG